MSDVKTTVRTLRVFEVFADTKHPLTLSELASKIRVPASSCLLIIRTLLNQGYLFEEGRNLYYPTGRMREICNMIGEQDFVAMRLNSDIEKLRDETSETVTLAKRQGANLIYLSVAESSQPVRATVRVGRIRPLHATATGKALLSLLNPEEIDALLMQAPLEKNTRRTITSRSKLVREIETSSELGWFFGFGESYPDLAAVSVPLLIDNSAYAVTIMGPSQRIEPNATKLAERLLPLVNKYSSRSLPASATTVKPRARKATTTPSRKSAPAK